MAHTADKKASVRLLRQPGRTVCGCGGGRAAWAAGCGPPGGASCAAGRFSAPKRPGHGARGLYIKKQSNAAKAVRYGGLAVRRKGGKPVAFSCRRVSGGRGSVRLLYHTAPAAVKPPCGVGSCRLESLPCKGRWHRRQAMTEGCIAALRGQYPSGPPQGKPRFVGRGLDPAAPMMFPIILSCAAGKIARPTRCERPCEA